MSLQDQLADFQRRDWQSVESTDSPIRFAMIGLGWWTIDEAIPAAQTAELCEPSVVVSGSSKKAERVKDDNDLNAALTYDEFIEGKATEAYDAVYIATPNHTHLQYVRAAAANGKDILCEKPMEITAERCEEMIEVCERAGVIQMIAYRMQTEPAVRRAREIVAGGFLGEINHIHSIVSMKLLDVNPNTDQWKLSPEKGGGAMFGTGVYPLNTTRFILEADPESVYAKEWSPTSPFADVDENTAFRLTFPNDIVASCTATHNNYPVTNLRILGTEGELNLEPIFHPWQSRTLRLAHDKMRTEFTVTETNQMVEEFEYFAHCLLTEAEPYPDGAHGQFDIKTVQAVHESARTGDEVSL